MFQLSGFYFKPSAPDSRSRPKPTAEPWALHSSSYENANHATGGQGAETASQPEMQHSNLDTQIAGSRIWVGPSGFRSWGLGFSLCWICVPLFESQALRGTKPQSPKPLTKTESKPLNPEPF